MPVIIVVCNQLPAETGLCSEEGSAELTLGIERVEFLVEPGRA